ncbi:intein-containing Rv2578c family radical SAM protein [Actinoallomurus purpureus]|uniref:intein-containing Rv2578c family radical SAM protein n=1 Tax=Actinoallomurus purpureus TaxID=478114 RepID=UPI0020938F26|nr:intein-containing Rv2578c family radical SAM protein [Actinoallomurus purpureus]MCO6003883.1 intein-containing Rv2578c family radical SAM protein [Actinoallomurus purpureus]
MRWDALSLDGEDPGPFGRPVTVDTPEFRGITFHEIRAKSIINRVPAASRVPFQWTINPYRGCSHACVYCLSGDTPILMADGRTKPLRDVRVGDAVYGTEVVGSYRRYVVTKVLAHWSTVKPAYRIRLEDGTELVASGDHRFLSDRGWKYVTGTECGAARRPHLTCNNKLVGTGQFTEPPKKDADYRAGYLCGMIRGDGQLGSYSYPSGDVHRFRLALVDREALDRSRTYLDDLGVPTIEFTFQNTELGRRQIPAIRNQSKAGNAAIRQMIAWPIEATTDWYKGFLAGIFDAEGSCSYGILRISNTDQEIIKHIKESLEYLRFEYRIEQPKKPVGLPVIVIRLLGGIAERLRFFHTVDPAITRKQNIEGLAIKTSARLGVTSIEAIGLELPMYDITTGTGDFIANGVVSHNCFARRTHEYLDFDSGRDFDSQIVVKVNAPELVRRELAAPKWAGEPIAMGTNVDCYQRAEGRYQLMPGIIEALRDAANPFSILTKGSLILRDLPLLEEAAERTDVSAAVSVGFVDKELWRLLEPGTPSPLKRLEVCATLNEHGIACGVLMGPIVPYLTDGPRQLDAAVRRIAETGATSLSAIVLHLRPGAREWFTHWLREHHPELIAPYARLYGQGAYAPKDYQHRIAQRVKDLADKYGIAGRRNVRRMPTSPTQPPEPEQLTLL